MTEELAARDAYARETTAVVVAITPDGIVLDRTVFYARGGGQPGDTGTITWPGGSAVVTDTFRARVDRSQVRSGSGPGAGPEPDSGGALSMRALKRDGAVLHQVAGEGPPVGSEVVARIDWERRHLLMRTHTALHVLSAVVWGDFGAKVTGGNMEPGEARMDFELEGITVEFGREVETRLNAALAGAHEVTVRFLPRAVALADPDLIRTKVNLIPETVDPIRVIEIGTIDKQADGGTHVANTREVGRVRVVGTESKGKANKRMRIALAEPTADS